jgi:hypothetical protein
VTHSTWDTETTVDLAHGLPPKLTAVDLGSVNQAPMTVSTVPPSTADTLGLTAEISGAGQTKVKTAVPNAETTDAPPVLVSSSTGPAAGAATASGVHSTWVLETQVKLRRQEAAPPARVMLITSRRLVPRLNPWRES